MPARAKIASAAFSTAARSRHLSARYFRKGYGVVSLMIDGNYSSAISIPKSISYGAFVFSELNAGWSIFANSN